MTKPKKSFKKLIAPVLAWIFYSVELEQTPWGNGHTKWNFRFHPRKVSILLLYTIFFSVIILLVGVTGLIQSLKGSFKVMDFSSYSFILPTGRKPKKIECYKKI